MSVRFSLVEAKAPNGYPVHNLNTGLNYTTIQEAINAPETLNGHTIFIDVGIFNENIIVNKALTLQGQNKSATIINGNGTAILTTTNGVMISNLMIQNQVYGSCIELKGVSGCKISNNFIYNSGTQIVVGVSFSDYSSFNNVSYNVIMGNIVAADFQGSSSYNVFSNNQLINNTHEVQLGGSYNRVLDNSFLGGDTYSIIAKGTSNLIHGNQLLESYVGIQVYNAINVTVECNNIVKTIGGIMTYDCQNCSILNNTVIGYEVDEPYSPGTGITTEISAWGRSNGIKIFGNMVEDFYEGICLPGDPNYLYSKCNVSYNKLKNNKYGIHIGGYQYGSNNNTIFCNNLTNNEYGIYILKWGSCNNITANMFFANAYGICLSDAGNNFIKNNILRDYTYGISASGMFSSYNTILSNDLSSGYYGIQCSGSSQNTIFGNAVTHNNNDGIFASECNYANVSSNYMANNNNGLRLFKCNNSMISKNTVKSNNGDGIHVEQSLGNTFVMNSLIDNYGFGIWLFGSSYNFIFHNTFNNTNQAYVMESPSTWDDGFLSGGNYWSDYTGGDSDYNAIGDAPYFIDENNQDNYPLMGIFSDFQVSSESHVQTICNSTISDFQFNGTAISFNVTGTEGTSGFCRICIPHSLINDPYQVLIDGVEPYYVNYTLYDNGTHRWIYFAYQHSAHEVVIVPEFPSFLILPISMIATLLAVIVYKRKHFA